MTRVRIPAVRAAALLGCALAARAEDRSPTQGIETPARSFAVEDSATSLSGNPAGLSYSSGVVLDFADEHGWRGPTPGGDGVYLSAAGSGLAAGLAVEWLRTGEECTPATPCSRRFTVGGAARFGFLAVGAAHHGFSSDESADLDHAGSWTLGALARPLRWLSLGYGVRDLNAPHFGASQLPRRHVAAIAVRPLREWVTVAADGLFRSCAPGVLQSCGIDHPDLSFSLEARILRGLSLVGQVTRGDSGSVTGQIGLQLDFAHLGVRSGTNFGQAINARSRTVVRLSSAAEPGIRVPVGRAVELDLDRSLRRPSPGWVELVLGETYRDPLALTLEAMRRLAGDPGVKAIVLRTGKLPLGAGRSDELRSGIEGLRAAGKKVAFYLESAGDLDYSVASSADRVFAAPQAVLAVNGFSATALFAAAGLDKLGVKAEFVRAGAYKNAPEIFTRRDMSSEQREVVNALLDDVYGRYVRRVSQARHLDEEKFRRLLDRGLLTPQEAQAEGLVDALVYPDQLEQEVGKLIGSRVTLNKIGTQPVSRRMRLPWPTL